jgi:hypothetical protein
MKGGIFALSENFIKILSTAFLAIVLLAIFIALNQYQLINVENRMDRETLAVGSIVLSSNCLIENFNYPIKYLLSQEKIDLEISNNPARNQNPSCLVYDKGIYVEVYDETNAVVRAFGNSGVCNSLDASYRCDKKSSTAYTVFPAAFDTGNGIIPVTVKIFLGVV